MNVDKIEEAFDMFEALKVEIEQVHYFKNYHKLDPEFEEKLFEKIDNLKVSVNDKYQEVCSL